jgi:alkylation response protein AidB-like acyl-CoA dehydrogenase
MSTTTDLDAYREQARAWLAANLERRIGDAPDPALRGRRHRSREELVPERALQRKLYEGGYAGITWPTEYGGQGLTPGHQQVFHEESSPYRLPDLGAPGGMTVGACGQTMLRHASPEFLARHVPRMLAGDELFVQFFSEPEAGSDLAGVRTRAVRDGNRWILTGSKIWTSAAYYADYGMCLARTDWDAPKHRGLTWFAVPIDAPGVTVELIKEINGEAEFCQEFLDEVEIPEEDVIGEVNQGWTVAQTMLLFERSSGRDVPGFGPQVDQGIDPQVIALAERVGRLDDPVTRQLIAQIHITDWIRTQLGERVGGLIRTSGKPASGIASYWKLAAGVYNPLRAQMLLDIGQGAPLAWRAASEDEDTDDGELVALEHLNSRVWSIAGGSNEMQRNAIGERVLDLPREPSFDSNAPFNEVVRAATRDWSAGPT